MYKQINIIAFSEEHKYRVFEYWGCEKVFASGPVLLEVDKPVDAVRAKAWEIYKQFLETGDKIRDQLINDYMFTSTTLKQAIEQLNIGPENVFMLTKDIFVSIEDYYDIYFEDEEIVLDDELGFPMPCYFSQYLEYSDVPFEDYNGFRS